MIFTRKGADAMDLSLIYLADKDIAKLSKS